MSMNNQTMKKFLFLLKATSLYTLGLLFFCWVCTLQIFKQWLCLPNFYC